MTSSWIPLVGAFGFGLVIGWFVYFTNRYRKGEAQLSDVTTVIGVIGGAAITALFGDAKSALFGAYGIGLAVGFFVYFITLLLLVKASNGAFSWTWFLDGRRKKLKSDEEIPGETRPSVAPMDIQPPQPSALTPPLPPTRSMLSEFTAERDRAIAIVIDSIRDILRRMGEATKQDERERLSGVHDKLTTQLDELNAARLSDIFESDTVKAALVKLRATTTELEVEAKKMKIATDAASQASNVINQVSKVIGFFGGIFV